MFQVGVHRVVEGLRHELKPLPSSAQSKIYSMGGNSPGGNSPGGGGIHRGGGILRGAIHRGGGGGGGGQTLRGAILLEPGKMARALPVEEFELCYKVDFNTVIRGYHYKKVWNGCCTGQLYCKHDTREEALENDKHAIGVYKLNSSTLVGHLPTELSSLIHFFLMDNADNRVLCNVIGKRYRELGLVLSATFKALTKHKKTGFKYLHLEHNANNGQQMFPFKKINTC